MWTYEITKIEELKNGYANYWYDLFLDGVFQSSQSLFGVKKEHVGSVVLGGLNGS